MAVISDVGDDCGSGVAVSASEFWQCRGGVVAVSTEGSPADGDGILLLHGQGIHFGSGVTVKYRRIGGGTPTITRTGVGA